MYGLRANNVPLSLSWFSRTEVSHSIVLSGFCCLLIKLCCLIVIQVLPNQLYCATDVPESTLVWIYFTHYFHCALELVQRFFVRGTVRKCSAQVKQDRACYNAIVSRFFVTSLQEMALFCSHAFKARCTETSVHPCPCIQSFAFSRFSNPVQHISYQYTSKSL